EKSSGLENGLKKITALLLILSIEFLLIPLAFKRVVQIEYF
ncbi:hypothetical protein LCGC14_2907540, partial [marine sediment metagenome]